MEREFTYVLRVRPHDGIDEATAEEVARQLMGALEVGIDPDRTPALWCAQTTIATESHA